ncbi:MAG: LPS-assembly protein LptD, partial [Kiritimatiellae bacterium]|nr:LPS-assembly protein LptD [Kiritimatiellia bacterium]
NFMRLVGLAGVLAAALAAGAAWGAPKPVALPSLATGATLGGADEMVDVQADRLAYDQQRKVIVARGHVRVARGAEWVTCDEAEVDTVGQIVAARGNIELHYGENVWKGEEATYNFRTGEGDFGTFDLFVPPWHVTAGRARRASESLVELEDVMLTSCDPENPEYSVRAGRASLESNRVVRARNVRFQLGAVPFFWFPYAKGDVRDFANFEFTPGYRSKWGAFLLTAYNYPLDDTWSTKTRVDLRAKRGIALGEDLSWKDPDGGYAGQLRLYWANDREPWRNETQRAEREKLIEDNRYWIRLTDRHNLTDRDYLISTLNYVGDPWMLDDFFDDEYQKNVQPENRVTLTHRGDRYSAGLELNTRLNDFYGNVNRLPEAFLDFNRQQIFGSPFYYEGENTATYLERVFPDLENDEEAPEDYDAFRVDTRHMVSLPFQTAGFLSVVPRAGWRGTYYSKTKENTVVTNLVAVTNELGEVTGVEGVPETLTSDGDAVFRSLPELGLETSFKAFGDLHRGPVGLEEGDQDLRHVLQPYADYTLRFEPNATPDELWQFDAIDRLDKANTLTLGLRNYLQTKRRGRVHNLVYADTWVDLNLDPEEDGEEFQYFGFKAELRPWSWLAWDFSGRYDNDAGEVDQFKTRVTLRKAHAFRLGVDYRYQLDTREQISGDLHILPEERWSARIYARMDIRESHLDEHSYFIIHRTDCLGIGVGLRIRPDDDGEGDDDYSVWLRIWPLVFGNSVSMP